MLFVGIISWNAASLLSGGGVGGGGGGGGGGKTKAIYPLTSFFKILFLF